MKFKIDLNTGNRFWTPKGLGALGMEPNQAIAELVANSLDWRRIKEDKVFPIIKVLIGKKNIEVLDNGVGMNSKEMQDAIQVSVSNDNIRPSLRIRKGMFGMGMKVACLSLGWEISIHSRSKENDSKENVLRLNTRELDDDGISNKYRKNISGFSGGWVENSPLTNWESGTSIQITDLTHKNVTAITVRDSLQQIFNPEIGVEKVSIEVIDLTTNESYFCAPTIVPIYERSKIDLDKLNLFVTDPETKKKTKIRGWIALMKSSSSGTGKWGIHLFKNNQIIERFHQLPKRLGGLMPKNPHPAYGRTYGEIHLDMCKPAFHKVGFDYSTEIWAQVQSHLAKPINTIMELSYNFRINDYEKGQKIVKAKQKHTRAVQRVVGKIRSAESNELPENAVVLPSGDWFTLVNPVFETLGDNEKMKPWIYHYRKKSKEVAIIINAQSSIYLKMVDPKLNNDTLEIFIAWAISDSLMFLLQSDFKFKIHDAISFRDEQLVKLTSNIEI